MDLERILTSDTILLSILDNLDELFKLIPELKDMVGFEHKNPNHHLNVWEHTLCALSMSPNDFEIRLALLLHDIGKPHSYTEGEVRHFRGHELVSARISRDILTRLDYDPEFINEVCFLIEKHDTTLTDEEIEENESLSYKRYIMQYCDTFAHERTRLNGRVAYLRNVYKNHRKSE